MSSRRRPTTLRRWRVERAGAPSAGYGRGWLAQTDTGVGAWFPDWVSALALANAEARADTIRHMLDSDVLALKHATRLRDVLDESQVLA